MADSKHAQLQRRQTDELTDAGSERGETETLNEEELPSYPTDHAQPPPPEKGTKAPGPTASNPFNFPAPPPSYEHVHKGADIRKPLAIPQTSPLPDAPFVAAYPTDLLSYGIPSESWHAFLDTVSAFLSAKVSQQALHHATDTANRIGDYHKQYATFVKNSFKEMGRSAKRFNPFGIVGQAIHVTLGTVGHAVGSVFNPAVSLIQKPKTPRERATVYVAAANADWFQARGLRALLLNTPELSNLLGTSEADFLSGALGRSESEAGDQLAALNAWIGDVKVRNTLDLDQQSTTSSSRAQASSSRLSPTPSRQSKASKGSASGDRSWTQQLRLGSQTLWLVVVPQESVVPVDKVQDQDLSKASQS